MYYTLCNHGFGCRRHTGADTPQKTQPSVEDRVAKAERMSVCMYVCCVQRKQYQPKDRSVGLHTKRKVSGPGSRAVDLQRVHEKTITLYTLP